ncbi:MAG: hypothetical protein HC801_12120 [Nitrospira sp.]|nr:hypothetical protein [Nitrospira sp.]
MHRPLVVDIAMYKNGNCRQSPPKMARQVHDYSIKRVFRHGKDVSRLERRDEIEREVGQQRKKSKEMVVDTVKQHEQVA